MSRLHAWRRIVMRFADLADGLDDETAARLFDLQREVETLLNSDKK